MDSTNTSTLDQFDGIENTPKETEETVISILIQDLNSTSNCLTSDVEQNLLSRLCNVLEKCYLEKERIIMIKFAFDFYADLSRQMQVPENLISENLTHAETYFEEKFNNTKNV